MRPRPRIIILRLRTQPLSSLRRRPQQQDQLAIPALRRPCSSEAEIQIVGPNSSGDICINQSVANSNLYEIPVHVARLIQAVVNSVPANANVHVDINPSGQGEFQHVASGQHLHQSQSQQQQSQSAQPQAHLQQVSSGMDNADRLTGEPGK